jgi:hypothetical protein
MVCRISERRGNLEVDERSGRPTAVRAPDMYERLRELILTDRRMPLRMMEEKIEISRKTIRKILVDDLGKWKICATFVPRCFTDAQEALIPQARQEFIRSVDDDISWLGSAVTGDETWCFQHDHQTKELSMEWRSPRPPRQRKILFKKTRRWSHYSTVRESFRKNFFYQVRRCVRNIMWMYCHVRFKEFVDEVLSFRKRGTGSSRMTPRDLTL